MNGWRRLAIVPCVWLIGCNGGGRADLDEFDSGTTDVGLGDVVADTSGADVPVTNVGLGGSCDERHSCRSGLVCDPGTSKCVGAGSGAVGAPCSIGPECASGVCGPKRACTDAGTGTEGSTCVGDGDCGKGLRCLFDGESVYPKCVKSGSADTAAPCASTRDCAQGLFCAAGSCTPAPLPTGEPSSHGIPAYIPDYTKKAWEGASCPAPIKGGTVTALFSIPRASDPIDGDFYKRPFPNDAARIKGKVSFANHPHDPGPPIGFDLLARYLTALETEPFGPYSTVFMRFDGEIDFDSLGGVSSDPGVRLVDLTSGATFGDRLGMAYYVTNGRNKYICPNYVALRPPRGAPLRPRSTYGVVIKKGVKASDGSLVRPAADLTTMLSTTTPADASLTDAWTAYQPLRDYLVTAKIPAADVVNATVFTVGDPRAIGSRLRASARAATAPAAEGWVRCDTGVKSPCTQAEGDRACGAADPAFDELHALVSLPIYQRGDAPYEKSGGDFDTTGTGAIAPVRTEKVCLSLTVPKGTPPSTGWPVALYAHGTGGSFRSHAIDGTAKLLSKIDLGGGVASSFAVLGIDQVAHGSRRGTSTRAPKDLFFNYANPAMARFGALQGAADQHALMRLLETLSVDATVTGATISFDPKRIVFLGHSQGATEGSSFLAYDTGVRGAVFSGQGGGLIDALLTKRAPVDVASSMWIVLNESTPEAVTVWHPVLSLLQWWADPADPVNFGALDVIGVGDAGASAPRHLLQTFGSKDTYTPKETQAAFAWSAGLSLVGPELESFGMTAVASVQGNVASGTAKVTAAVRQYASTTSDGHFVLYDNDGAKTDVAKFLARAARGETPKIPE